jgi:hypothetical protein
VDCEKDWWNDLEWDGLDVGHHPSLFRSCHSGYYKKQMLRSTVLRWVADLMCLLVLLGSIVQVRTQEQHALSYLHALLFCLSKFILFFCLTCFIYILYRLIKGHIGDDISWLLPLLLMCGPSICLPSLRCVFSI